LIAKLERPEALDNLEAIIDMVDGVMVARGDLGVEMAPEDVPGAQKRIIQVANRKGKIVITATQMLESMIHNPLRRAPKLRTWRMLSSMARMR